MKPLPVFVSDSGASLVFSRYARPHAASEQCVTTHGLTYLLAGSLRVVEAAHRQEFGAGSLLFVRKNFLAKFRKQPAANGLFEAITVQFTAPMLLAAAQLAGGMAETKQATLASHVQLLPPDGRLHQFFAALRPYFEQPLPAPLAAAKAAEALTLLLRAQPALGSVLFDFGQPGKLDLEAYLQQGFRFNVTLSELAHLTGRSLAALKRDFARIFHTPPARWLYQRRLEEAHYLLAEEGRRPSDVYHEVGFESLAHFSTAFKQYFGRTPSSLQATRSAS